MKKALYSYRGTSLLITISLLFGLVLSYGCSRPDPAEVRKRNHLPAPGFVASAEQGKHIFAGNCVKCHGEEARGTNRGPSLVDQVYRPAHHADLTFHWAVKNGVRQHHWKFGDMPPQSHISPEETGHIVAYIRSLQKKAGIFK